MTPDPLSPDEERYLLAAFQASPLAWFRRDTVDAAQFAFRNVDVLIESLARRGLVQGEPDCHIRLTDRGRRESGRLRKLASRDWPRFYRRRRAIIVAAILLLAAAAVLLVSKWIDL